VFCVVKSENLTGNASVAENADRTVPLITWNSYTECSIKVDLRLRNVNKLQSHKYILSYSPDGSDVYSATCGTLRDSVIVAGCF